MTTPVQQSPLRWLLDEEREGDRQARSALFLSFNVDHAFFEATALGAAQAAGARVAVVGDATVNATDPLGARRTGRSYFAGQAVCDGCFHPKVMVLTGRLRGLVAVGSGNLSLSGWHHNVELWTVFHAKVGSVPAVFGQVAEWLRHLPRHVSFGRYVSGVLIAVAEELDEMQPAAQSEDGPRIVHNLTGSIIDQLPHGPVDELAVCAPFHDPGAKALSALIDRLQPGRVRISYQPELAQLDGSAIANLLNRPGDELFVDAEHKRYRHGKLIEWTVGGQRFALTGSPNLSAAALINPTDRGGNCELAVLTEIAVTRLPDGSPAGVETIRTSRITNTFRRSGGPLLLGASRTSGGLLVELASELATAVSVEVSLPAPAPLDWKKVGQILAGTREIVVPVIVEGGSRVRASIEREAQVQRSPVVFVVDPDRALRRPTFADSARRSTQPIDLFTDHAVLRDQFAADLAELISSQPAPPVTAGASGKAPRQADHVARTQSGAAVVGWEAHLDRITGKMGNHLVRFALGLPSINPAAHDRDDATLSDDELTDFGLDGDQAEDIVDADETLPTTMPDVTGAPAAVRARYRKWATHIVEAAAYLGIVERLLVARLLLWTIAAGAWSEDREWIPLLSRALVALGDSTDLEPPAEPAAGSLAAVGLIALRKHAPRSARTAATQAYSLTAASVAHLLPTAEKERITEYGDALDRLIGYRPEAESILELAAQIVQDDPMNEALLDLDERGYTAHRDGDRLLHITDPTRRPELAALHAIGATESQDQAAAWASTDSGTWTILVWRRPDLFRIDGAPDRPSRWLHYRCTSLTTPNTMAHRRTFDNDLRVRHVPSTAPIPEALHALRELGIIVTQQPTCTFDDAR